MAVVCNCFTFDYLALSFFPVDTGSLNNAVLWFSNGVASLSVTCVVLGCEEIYITFFSR